MKIKQYGQIRELTEEELLEMEELDRMSPQEEVCQLMQCLSDTDYQAIKYAEGLLSETEYSKIRLTRQAWRDRINELQKQF